MAIALLRGGEPLDPFASLSKKLLKTSIKLSVAP